MPHPMKSSSCQYLQQLISMGASVKEDPDNTECDMVLYSQVAEGFTNSRPKIENDNARSMKLENAWSMRHVLSWLGEEHHNSSADAARSTYVNSDAFSDITDPAESRPGSSLQGESETTCNVMQEAIGSHGSPMTYFLSLPNSDNWSVIGKNSRASCDYQNRVPTVSPSLDSLSSRYSPLSYEASFYEDIGIFNRVPIGGRATPPPPYRPPLANNSEPNSDTCPGSAEMTPFLDSYTALGRMTPPPPYEPKTATRQNPDNSTTCTNFSRNMDSEPSQGVSTAERRDLSSPPGFDFCLSWDVSMPTPPSEVEAPTAEEGSFSALRFEEGAVESERDIDEKKVFVPADPEEWTEHHISQWLQWTRKHFPIGPIDRTQLPTDGATLCRFSAEDFRRVTGDKQASEILITHLAHLKQASGHSPKSFEENKVDRPEVKQENPTTFFDAVKELLNKCLNQDNRGSSSSTLLGGGQVHLWQFLLELLSHSENCSIIAWENEEGEFRLIDPEEVARRWGAKKSKPNMNYDKLSRALRYYYDKGIMNKVSGKRYTYRFDFDGIVRACQPTGVSDSCFIQPGFEQSLETCDYTAVRNFNLQSLLNKDVKKNLPDKS